jgi:hypothetical protein
MTRVYSSVREAYLGFLLGEVEEDDPTPSTSSSYTKPKHRASFPGTTSLSRDGGGERCSGKLTQSLPSNSYRFTVRTISNDEDRYDDRRKEIDTSTLSQEDLSNLQKTDPFLYYSIPSSIRRRFPIGMHNYHLDHQESQEDDTMRRSSFPIMQPNHYLDHHENNTIRRSSLPAFKQGESIVRRSSRISTEVHPDLIYGEMILSDMDKRILSDMDDKSLPNGDDVKGEDDLRSFV